MRSRCKVCKKNQTHCVRSVMCSYVSLKSATVSAVFILSDISSFTFEMDCVCIHCVSETVTIQVFNVATLNPMDMD